MGCCGPGQGHGGHGSGKHQTPEKQFSWIVWIMLFIIIGLLLFGILR